MNEPIFSVIIPTYNRADFIKETIESVLKQTFTSFEVIVVDDGSKDNTSEIVNSIDDARVIYHYKKNEERAVARNTGINLAKGKYITFLDSDDLLYENHLENAAEVIEKYNEPEFFHLGYEFKDASNNRAKKVDFLPEIANKKLIDGNYLSCNAVFLRKDITAKNLFNPDRDLSGTEDYEFWLRLASRYPLYCDNRITSVIVQHDSRSVITTNGEKLIKRIELLESYLLEDEKFVKKFGENLAAFQANNRIYIALHLALTKKYRLGAISFLLKSLFFSPKAFKNRAFYGTIKRLIF